MLSKVISADCLRSRLKIHIFYLGSAHVSMHMFSLTSGLKIKIRSSSCHTATKYMLCIFQFTPLNLKELCRIFVRCVQKCQVWPILIRAISLHFFLCFLNTLLRLQHKNFQMRCLSSCFLSIFDFAFISFSLLWHLRHQTDCWLAWVLSNQNAVFI